MEIAYRRNLKNSYMVIKGEEQASDYDRKMLERHQCSSFLPAEVMQQDGDVQYWYEVSGKQSLDVYMSVHPLKEQFFERFLYALGQMIEWMQGYLLEEEHLILLPETIFLEVDTMVCSFCYCPVFAEELTVQFRKLMEKLLQKTDHASREAVRLAYRLYDVSLKEGYRFAELMDAVQEERQLEVSQESSQEVPQKIRQESLREESQNGGKEESRHTPAHRKEAPQHTPARKEKPEFLTRMLEIFSEKKGLFWESLPSEWRERFHGRKKEEAPLYFEPEEEQTRESHPTILLAKREEEFRGILLYEGSGEQEDIKITEVPFLIGSDSANVQGVICSETVSRVHAKITREGGVYFLEDLNSTNGTFLDGDILNYKVKVSLRADCRIRFADECYRFL